MWDTLPYGHALGFQLTNIRATDGGSYNENAPFFSEDKSIVEEWLQNLRALQKCVKSIEEIKQNSHNFGKTDRTPFMDGAVSKQGYLLLDLRAR